MEELLPRSEAIKHLRHHGRKDPNLYIYSQYLENGLVEKAARFLNYRQTWEKVRREGKRLLVRRMLLLLSIIHVT
jgi:hypothetical protein